MPDAPTFQLPRPSQPASHHALVLHNAAIFEYDLQEFGGPDGGPLVVVEPRRMDGKPQGPFTWFRARLLEAVNALFDGDATVVIHERPAAGGENWWITRDIPVPVFNEKDPAVRAQLEQIQREAAAAGVRPEQAVHQAVMSGALTPSDVRMQHALLQVDENSVGKVLGELFASHVEPPPGHTSGRRPVSTVGFAGQAVAQDRVRQADAGGLVA